MKDVVLICTLIIIQTNDGSEHLTARSVIGIVESVAPLLEHPEPTFLETIEKDLEQVIYNIHLGSAVLHSSCIFGESY